MSSATLVPLRGNLATKILGSPRRRAGWWSAALLGALLVMPAELVRADEADRGERAASSRASSGSKSSGSSAKASSASRSSSRSQPRASSRSSSRSQPRASGSSSRRQSRAKATPTRRSSEATHSRSDRRAKARARHYRAPEARERAPKARNRNVVRNEGSRPGRGAAPPKIENVRVVDRTEIATPKDSAPRVENTRPIDRTAVSPRRRLTRPRGVPPAERPLGGQVRGPNAAVERRGPADAGDWKRHYEIDEVAPVDPSTAPPYGHKGYGKHPRGRGHGGRYGGHHHRHHYGCGHYGYGNYGYGYYNPFDHGYSFGYYSPSFYLGLGSYWAPEVHVYGGGGGGSARYRDVGQGALDLDLRPETTEIYIDGTYVGVADEFDGFPTYLWLEEGTYEIAFYKQGFETIFRQYTIYPGVTIDVRDHMRPGEAVLPVPAGAYPATSETAYPSEPRPRTGTTPRIPSAGDGGRIAIVATPGDAAVYLDGHFVGTAAEISELGAGLIVEPGDHVVDIIRPGYDNQRVPVSVATGERIDLKLDLRRP